MPNPDPVTLVRNREYMGKFVALRSFSDHTVVASGNDVSGVLSRAAKKGCHSAVVMKVPAKRSVCLYSP